MEPSAYFVRLDDHRFRATEHTSGAWSVTEQHISPMTGLVAHEMERVAADDGKLVARLCLDILGVIAVDDFEVTASVVRPGRTVSLVEARVTQAGRPAAIARAWRLSASDTTEVAGGEPDPMPNPDDVPTWDMTSVWPGGYIASLDVRRTADTEPGRTRAWVRSPLDLVADEPVGEVPRWLALLDTANGLSVRRSPKEWMFPNVDLTVHLHRQPRGPWVGFDTTVTFGADGLGLTDSGLHDQHGPVGRAAQALTVRRL